MEPSAQPLDDHCVGDLAETWLASRRARGFITSAHTTNAYRSDLAAWASKLSTDGTL